MHGFNSRGGGTLIFLPAMGRYEKSLIIFPIPLKVSILLATDSSKNNVHRLRLESVLTADHNRYNRNRRLREQGLGYPTSSTDFDSIIHDSRSRINYNIYV